mgnify:FL=1
MKPIIPPGHYVVTNLKTGEKRTFTEAQKKERDALIDKWFDAGDGFDESWVEPKTCPVCGQVVRGET